MALNRRNPQVSSSRELEGFVCAFVSMEWLLNSLSITRQNIKTPPKFLQAYFSLAIISF